jgi:predicted RNA polymerase sigma factor
MPSPAVEVNRAVAYCMAFGSEAGLKLIDEIARAAAWRNYTPVPAAKGGFLLRAGWPKPRSNSSATGITRNEREKAFFLGRAAARGC